MIIGKLFLNVYKESILCCTDEATEAETVLCEDGGKLL